MTTTGERKLTIHRWPLWKSLAAALALYLPLTALLVVIPPSFSRSALLLAGGLIGVGVCGLMWGRWGSPRVSEIAGSFILTSQFLVIGLRAWSAVMPVRWTLVTIVIALFILAWVLPLLMPGLSTWLWREQVAPQTRAGRRLLAVSVLVFPSVGIVGASAGLFLSKTDQAGVGWVVVAALAMAAAMAWAQSTSHRLLSSDIQGR